MGLIDRLSMLELGRRLGVDRATVSRALAARIRRILWPRRPREQIRTEASRLGFSPDAAAAALRRGRSQAIGILTPDLLNEVFVRVIRETVAYLNRNTAEASRIIPLVGETSDRPGRVPAPAPGFRRQAGGRDHLAGFDRAGRRLAVRGRQTGSRRPCRAQPLRRPLSFGALRRHGEGGDGGSASYSRSCIELSVKSRGRDARRRSRIVRKGSRACAAARSSSSRRAGLK